MDNDKQIYISVGVVLALIVFLLIAAIGNKHAKDNNLGKYQTWETTVDQETGLTNLQKRALDRAELYRGFGFTDSEIRDELSGTYSDEDIDAVIQYMNGG